MNVCLSCFVFSMIMQILVLRYLWESEKRGLNCIPIKFRDWLTRYQRSGFSHLLVIICFLL